jgi:hypothetical protein
MPVPPQSSHHPTFLIALLLGICVVIFLHMVWWRSGAAAAMAAVKPEPFVSVDLRTTHHIYNEYNLGDALFTMMYFNQIADYIEANNISVKFYIKPEYIGQVTEFTPNRNVEVLPLGQRPATGAYDIWLGRQFNSFRGNRFKEIDNLIIHTHNIFAKRAGLPLMKDFQYSDGRLLERYQALDNSCKNVDILILNSEPKSYQFKYDKADWDVLVRSLAAKYKVVTTTKVDGVPCTADFKYSIKDIAAVSTHAHYIIAVNSGPLVGCFNTDTLRNIKKMYVFDNVNNYAPHSKITHLSSVDELANYFP